VVFNSETVRKTTYLVAGILPATFFAIPSLLLIITPAFFWTAAAWAGVVGLVLAFNRRPYNEIHSNVALMLIIGIAAMAPAAIFMLPSAPFPFELNEGNASALIYLCVVSPIFVALHFLYFQTILLISRWLSMLVTNREPAEEIRPTDNVHATIA